ncbi:MAG: hypothetical protein CBHOC_3145 [uncultured Caballeronia sp.]|nr:MAG: hypothetical protein CBHOC_3145 [uncultured Caballeronia sp.]
MRQTTPEYGIPPGVFIRFGEILQTSGMLDRRRCPLCVAVVHRCLTTPCLPVREVM